MSVIMQEKDLKEQIAYMKRILNERQYRCYLGKLAISIGSGGQALVARLSGASINTVRRGVQEVKENATDPEMKRIRKPGGGRKSASIKYPDLQRALEEIIDGESYGDPERGIILNGSVLRIGCYPGETYGGSTYLDEGIRRYLQGAGRP